MNLEQQVCSLGLAKRLKELGVKQESIHFWIQSSNLMDNRFILYTPDETHDGQRLGLSAFTVAELLNMVQELRKSDILIPLNIKVADYLATELVKEYE